MQRLLRIYACKNLCMYLYKFCIKQFDPKWHLFECVMLMAYCQCHTCEGAQTLDKYKFLSKSALRWSKTLTSLFYSHQKTVTARYSLLIRFYIIESQNRLASFQAMTSSSLTDLRLACVNIFFELFVGENDFE